MASSKQPQGVSNSKNLGCTVIVLLLLVGWIGSKIPGCTSSPGSIPAPVDSPTPSPTPTPAPQVVLNAYALLGLSRSQVRKFISSHGFKLTADSERDKSESGDGDPIDDFQGPRGVNGIEVLASYSSDNLLNHITVQNLYALKIPLDDSAQLLPRFGVTGLEADPEHFPAAWHWQDLRDMKVRTVETAAPPLASNPDGYIDFLQLKLE